MKQIKQFVVEGERPSKNIITNIYRIQACGYIMWGYFCIAVIDFTLKGKSFEKSKCQNEHEKILKKEEPTEILKIIGLFKNV